MVQFSSFAEAARWFNQKANQVASAMPEMTEKAAEIVAEEAKAELGSYQDGVGPFDPWAKLSQHTMDERKRLGFPPDAPLIRGGTLKESIKVITHGNRAEVGTDVPYAAALEYGTSKMPARPFLSRAVFVKQDEIKEEQMKILTKVLKS